MAKKITLPNFRKLPKRRLVTLTVVVIAGLTGWLAVNSLNGPSIGSIYEPSEGRTVKKQAYIELSGQEAVFNYPEEYQLQPPGRQQPNIIEDYVFKKSAGGNRAGNLTLAVSIYRLQSDKLEEDGAYRIRNQNPSTYIKRLSSVNSQAFTIFKKVDGSETVAFVRDGNRVATIAMSGTLAGSNQSEAEFTSILNSWQWKK